MNDEPNQSAGESPDDQKPESIQKKGGKARAAKLTKEQLSEAGKKAIAARWANRPLRASHKGTFSEHFGTDVDCYVLDDEKHTAVLSERGMGRTLGLSDTGGNKLKDLLATKKLAAFVGPELSQKLAQPIKFQWGTGGPESPPTNTVHGFDATTLIDVCNVIMEAEAKGVTGARFDRAARQAKIIVSASAKGGIRDLVYALAGYSPAAEDVISAFKLYVQEEAKKYEKEFPNELYQQWYRLYEEPERERGKPWLFKKLTVEHVYRPLAKSNSKILELMRALKAEGGDRRKKLFQFLSDIGTRALRIHLGRLLEMAEDSDGQEAYEKRFNKRFGEQQEFDFPPTS